MKIYSFEEWRAANPHIVQRETHAKHPCGKSFGLMIKHAVPGADALFSAHLRRVYDAQVESDMQALERLNQSVGGGGRVAAVRP